MNQHRWENKITQWIQDDRNIDNKLSEPFVQFFTLVFENTSCPAKACFGIHGNTKSLVVGGIFLAAIIKSGNNKGIWLLLQYPPEIDGWKSWETKSTKSTPKPLKWLYTSELPILVIRIYFFGYMHSKNYERCLQRHGFNINLYILGWLMIRHEFIAGCKDSLLLIIDFQVGMLKVINTWEKVAGRVNQLIQTSNILGIPILLTEQYKKGLGETHPEILQKIRSPVVCQKEHFSACMERDFLSAIHSFGRNKIIVAGMETHVCVLQTCLDLIKAGFQIHLVADAVASREIENRDIAIDLLRQAGALVSSTEIVIFQWAYRANTENFRKILPVVK